MENKKPEEISCPECNSKDWLLPERNLYLINSSIIAVSMNTFKIINSALNEQPINGAIPVIFAGVRIYECKNCKYNKFYNAIDTVEDINNALSQLEKVTHLTFKKIDDKGHTSAAQ